MKTSTSAALLVPFLLLACSVTETVREDAAAVVGAAAASGSADEGPSSAAIARANAALDGIAALPADARTFANTLLAFDAVVGEYFRATQMTAFLANVSTDAEERERGRAAQAQNGQWYSEIYKRRDLFEAFRTFEGREDSLSAPERRLLQTTLRDFRREGMALSEEERARLQELDNQLNELGIEFRQNIADDGTTLFLTAEELAGCPEDWIAGLPRSADLYLVAAKGPNIRQVSTYCDVPATRLKLVTALGQRAATKNVAVLEKLLRLRHEKARLLGFPTTAHYEIEARMAQTPENVAAFYDDLVPKLRRKALVDLEEYTQAKREHTGDPDATLNVWDMSYYKNWLLREKYAVDSQRVREYFPLQAVREGLFDVTQSLYRVRYVDVTDRARAAGRPVWHEDAELYEVWDEETGELLGEFYLDLHPRPNKYNHAAQFPIELRRESPDGTVSRPLVALVCNFTKPTADKPSLLTHDEVQTFFHEFGHCLHSIFTQAPYALLSGTNVARDFVEAPSQMFENWVWDADVLAGFTRHYETGEPLPADLLERMIAAKNLGSGLSTEGQVYLGSMDIAFHSDEDGEVDTDTVREEVYRRTRLFPVIENSHSQASFGHLVGYQAGYYGYLWSLVYAADMFSRFEDRPMNPEVAAEYRDAILSQGGMREEIDMVRAFLGREPNADAFLRELGLDTE